MWPFFILFVFLIIKYLRCFNCKIIPLIIRKNS